VLDLLGPIFSIVVIDLTLSGDNAVVIGMAALASAAAIALARVAQWARQRVAVAVVAGGTAAEEHRPKAA